MIAYIKRICFLLIFLSSFIFLNFSCEDKIIDPKEIEPGRRDYVWTVDSVDYDSIPGTIELTSIWGSDPNNVWGAGFTEDVRNCLWHYDGEKWSRAVWNTPITEPGEGSKMVGGVWGTSADDVWAFGGKIFSATGATAPFIMHFDGNEWTEITGDINQMPDGFTDIYVIRKDHFWVSSSDHISEYKDGNWKKYLVGDFFYIESISGVGNSIYFTAYPIGTDSLYLYEVDGEDVRVIDRTNLLGIAKFEQSGLIFTNNKAYTFGRRIISAKTQDDRIIFNSWEVELIPEIGGFSNSFMINSKDIWAIGLNSYPHQFNGSNWQLINIGTLMQNSNLKGFWGDGNEIFICDIENGKVYHGK